MHPHSALSLLRATGTELQEYIVSLSTWQQIRDRRKPWREVFEELVTYDRITKAWIKAWGNGHIKVVLSRCNHFDCSEFYGPLKLNHVEVFGHFLNVSQEKKTYSLGNSLKEVLDNIELHTAHILGVERLPAYLFVHYSRAAGTNSP